MVDVLPFPVLRQTYILDPQGRLGYAWKRLSLFSEIVIRCDAYRYHTLAETGVVVAEFLGIFPGLDRT